MAQAGTCYCFPDPGGVWPIWIWPGVIQVSRSTVNAFPYPYGILKLPLLPYYQPYYYYYYHYSSSLIIPHHHHHS